MKPLKPQQLPEEYRWNSIPEILYETPQPGQKGSAIPYIEVPQNKKMPPVLFLFEYKLTGEYEPDEKGQPQEIVDQIPHKYVDLEFLFSRLNNNIIEDKIRLALGMEQKLVAKQKGEKILSSVFGKAEQVKQELIDTQKERMEKVKESLEKVEKKS